MNNSHCIYVKYIGPSNHRGSRVKLMTYDVTRDSLKAIILPYDHASNGTIEQAIKFLQSNGLEVIALNERGKIGVIMAEWNIQVMKKIFKVKGE